MPTASIDSPRGSASSNPIWLTRDDLYLFNEGRHLRSYQKLGAHAASPGSTPGTHFAVWAPNAGQVNVVGSFNHWEPQAHRLAPCGNSGIWEGFVAEARKGDLYKFRIESHYDGYVVDKADPFGIRDEEPPNTASIIWDLEYEWGDGEWMKTRGTRSSLSAPISIYEMHLGSWRRVPEENHRRLTYRELAAQLPEYVESMGFTHVELLPVMEHPFYGSWGYETTGYFAPTARYGTPQDFMFLVDCLHQRGIGVILDWVPSHFPSDAHGLAYFDGTHLFEHADPRRGFHPDWNTCIFNYGRNEVRSFLLSSGMFWLDKYHADGLRVDAVASMLYLDYSRRPGEWLPNQYGGRENLEAIEFLRQLNRETYAAYSDVQIFAEESTAWPMVSRPVYVGGLGFGLKWDMGWMHDTLEYFQHDPIHRKYHHNQLTFRAVYAFTENFVLPLSHDEVVHGKGSLIGKMPGDEWQRFANLRLLLGYMFAQPGKKLLFMGGEFAQLREWTHDSSLDWDLLHCPAHSGLQRWLRDLNRTYGNTPALHELDTDPSGFEWIDCNDHEASTISWLRNGKSSPTKILVACNFTPMPRFTYRLGVPWGGFWKELLNSDAREYGGSGMGNLGGVLASEQPAHGRRYSIELTLPPLASVFLSVESR